jgi:hypothetical protein
MSFEAESNSELTVIVLAYQLHFRFPVRNKIHKQKILLGHPDSIAGPCDFLPARSNEFQKVCHTVSFHVTVLLDNVDSHFLFHTNISKYHNTNPIKKEMNSRRVCMLH